MQGWLAIIDYEYSVVEYRKSKQEPEFFTRGMSIVNPDELTLYCRIPTISNLIYTLKSTYGAMLEKSQNKDILRSCATLMEVIRKLKEDISSFLKSQLKPQDNEDEQTLEIDELVSALGELILPSVFNDLLRKEKPIIIADDLEEIISAEWDELWKSPTSPSKKYLDEESSYENLMDREIIYWFVGTNYLYAPPYLTEDEPITLTEIVSSLTVPWEETPFKGFIYSESPVWVEVNTEGKLIQLMGDTVELLFPKMEDIKLGEGVLKKSDKWIVETEFAKWTFTAEDVSVDVLDCLIFMDYLESIQ